MNDAPFISVVTPVYNTGAYLEESLRSVLGQTRRDFELVIVDNYSTDNSSEIAARLAAEDARVRLLKPPSFFKQVDNYNFSLGQISPHSRYVKIVQADDWIFPRCLEELVAVALQDDQIGVVGSYRMVGAQPDGFGLPLGRSVFSGREACRAHVLDAVYPFGSPSTVLYRADLVRARRPFFPLDVMHFDTDCLFDILTTEKFGFAHQVLSYSRRQEESISGSTAFFNPNELDHVLIIKKFGERFMDRDEYAEVMTRELQGFYRGLARQWFKDRAGQAVPGFWEYQQKGLSEIGAQIDRGLLARAVVALGTEKVVPRVGVDAVRRVAARAFREP